MNSATIFLCLLLLTPIPRPEAQTPAPHPIVGAWAIDWGTIEQTTIFHANGTCLSPEYGAGVWSQDDAGTIWFSERDGEARYLMRIDLLDGLGGGAGVWMPTAWRLGPLTCE